MLKPVRRGKMRVGVFRHAALLGAISAVSLLLASPGDATASPEALLHQYEPVMQFDPLERFFPTRVQSFILDSDLEQFVSPGTWELVDARPGPGNLPGMGAGPWRLNQSACTPAAPLGGLDCYAAAGNRGRAPVVYGRLVRQDARIVLQYWSFYYDDLYSYTYPPSDFVWQAHEGDWEVVNVVLSDDEEPLYVGYSQHCVGTRRSWEGTPRFDGTHPVVHVALGSHANYFSAGVHPIDSRCIPSAALAILQLNGLPPPVDYAFAGALAGPPTADGPVIPIERIDDERPPWVGFPGFWGELQYFHAPAPVRTVAFGTSPVGPAFHAIWHDPVGTLAAWSPG